MISFYNQWSQPSVSRLTTLLLNSRHKRRWVKWFANHFSLPFCVCSEKQLWKAIDEKRNIGSTERCIQWWRKTFLWIDCCLLLLLSVRLSVDKTYYSLAYTFDSVFEEIVWIFIFLITCCSKTNKQNERYLQIRKYSAVWGTDGLSASHALAVVPKGIA